MDDPAEVDAFLRRLVENYPEYKPLPAFELAGFPVFRAKPTVRSVLDYSKSLGNSDRRVLNGRRRRVASTHSHDVRMRLGSVGICSRARITRQAADMAGSKEPR